MFQRILGAILMVSVFAVLGAQAVPCAMAANEPAHACCCCSHDRDTLSTESDCATPQDDAFTDGGCPCAGKSSPKTVPQPSGVRSGGQFHETANDVGEVARIECFEPLSPVPSRVFAFPPKTGPPRFIRHCAFLI